MVYILYYPKYKALGLQLGRFKEGGQHYIKMIKSSGFIRNPRSVSLAGEYLVCPGI